MRPLKGAKALFFVLGGEKCQLNYIPFKVSILAQRKPRLKNQQRQILLFFILLKVVQQQRPLLRMRFVPLQLPWQKKI